MPEINNMGQVNNHYGVCGFTSALYALYTQSPEDQQEYLSSAAKYKSRVAAEIKMFLKTLEAEGDASSENSLFKQITDFTRTFGDTYANFSIPKYVSAINTMTTGTAQADSVDISIAMPPEAVVKYLREICNLNSAMVDPSQQPWPKEAIIGVRHGKTAPGMYDGLEHYVYRKEPTVYSWGDRFKSLAHAGQSQGRQYEACVMIAISK